MKALASIPTICFALILTSSVFAAPGLMNYQGRLTDNEGKPVTTPVDLTFTFWNAETGGSQLGSGFNDTDTVTPSAAGVYSTMIGDDPGYLIPSSVFTGDSVWLNVNVGGEDLSPRKRITSVGYAMQAGGASDVRRIIQDFVVEDGQSVTAGDVVGFVSGKVMPFGKTDTGNEHFFHSGGTSFHAAAALTDTEFVMVYRDEDNGGYGTAVVGTINDLTINWGQPVVFYSSPVNFLGITALSESLFVIAFQSGLNPWYGRAIVGNYSSTRELSFEKISTFNEAQTENISITALVDKNFALAYTDVGESSYGKVRCGTVGRMQISWRDPTTCIADETAVSSIAGLEEDRFVVCFSVGSFFFNVDVKAARDGPDGPLYSPACRITDGTIEEQVSLAALTGDRFVVSYLEHEECYARVGIASPKNITLGPEIHMAPSPSVSIYCTALSENRVLFTYNDQEHFNGHGTGIVATISDQRIFLEPKFVFKQYNCRFSRPLRMTESNFVIHYIDLVNTDYGVAVAGKTSSSLLGVADSDGIGGDTVPVILRGISTRHSGLCPGKRYYAGGNGSLDGDPDTFPVGMALSETNLLLDNVRP